MSVRYTRVSTNTELSAKPERYVAGDYRLTYGIDGIPQTCDVYFQVGKAASENFTVTLSKAEWKYGDTGATAEIKNPSGEVVSGPVNTLNENDTDCYGFQYYCVKKSEYDAHPAAHKTYTALTTHEEDDTGSNKYFGNALISYYEDQEGQYQTLDYMGEYVFITLIQETGNYKEIVCTTEFTVTEPETPYGKTFVLTDITVSGDGGSAAPDDIVTFYAQKKAENLGKTLICETNGAITGTCNFGGGSFDEYPDEYALKLLEFGRAEGEHWAADPVYVKINNSAENSLLEGHFYGGKLYLTVQQQTYDETPIPYYLHFTFALQTED